jgi:hypothetical protein
MKNKIALTLIAITLAGSAFGQGYHYNNGYIDHNGVFHPGHFQTNPNNNPWDNWNTRGNYNPFNGQPGHASSAGEYDQFGVWHPY